MSDHRERIFHNALERIDLAKVPTLAGWTRKLAEVEIHKANYGKVNEAGCLIVQSGRKTDDRTEQAFDLFSCLPEKPRAAALIFARYCNPWMLEDYPGILREVSRAGLWATRDGWQGWTRNLINEATQHDWRFWRLVGDRRVVRRV